MHPWMMTTRYRNGKLTSHFTLEMLSDGISEHETFKIFLGEHVPRPPYILGGFRLAVPLAPPLYEMCLRPCIYRGGREREREREGGGGDLLSLGEREGRERGRGREGGGGGSYYR